MNSSPDKTPTVNVEDLVWAMLDEQISEQEFSRLDELLRDDEEARRLYLQCVQLHVDLASFYAAKDKPASSVGLPVSVPLPAGDAPLSDPAV